MTAMTDKQAQFWDRIAQRYAAKPVPDAAAYATTLARTRAYLRPTDRVLEAGAGTGSTAITLAPLVARYTASDIAAGMVRIGREKADAAGLPTLDLVQGTLATAPEGPFDAVLAFNLLHLCPDPAAEITRAAALLPPGGHFISKTACLGDGFQLLWPLIGAMRLIGKAPRVGFLRRRALEAMIRDAGFEILETGDYPARPPAHFVVARKR